MTQQKIKVPLATKVEQADYNGIPVKEAYWTAGYDEGSTVRHTAPLNHGMTCILDGKALGLEMDVLVRDGNGLINLEPRALVLMVAETTGEFREFLTEELPKNKEKELLTSLGVFEANESVREVGITAHYSRMEQIRTMLERQ